MHRRCSEGSPFGFLKALLLQHLTRRDGVGREGISAFAVSQSIPTKPSVPSAGPEG